MAAPVLPSNGETATQNGTSTSTGPQTYRILVLAGDHVGPEVMKEAVRVLELLESKRSNKIKFQLTHELAGGCSMDARGTPVTEEVLRIAKEESDAVLFGSVGGPKWGTAYPNPESSLLRLRQHINAFANIRPATFYSKSLIPLSPLKPHLAEPVNFIVLRENCGGAYYGTKIEEADFASDTWGYATHEVERCARVAAALARTLGKDGAGGGGPATVWSSDKANVLANSRLWRRVVTRVYEEEFPDIELKHQLADSLSMIMMTDPARFNGVILTDNTFGDMLSDQAGGVIGTLGLLPSASLCGIPGDGQRCNGIYEPVHGSAPDISGMGIVNPIAEILSAALLLRYSLGLTEEALQIEQAVAKVLDSKDVGGLEIRTGDLGGKYNTVQVGDAVCQALAEILDAADGTGAAPVSVRGQNGAGSLEEDFRKLGSPIEANVVENKKWEEKVETNAKTGPETAIPLS